MAQGQRDAQEGLKRVEPHVATAASRADANADPAKLAAHDIDVGETYLAGNHFDAARERFEEALRLTPDNPLGLVPAGPGAARHAEA